MTKKSKFPTILAYVSLGLVLLGAIPGLGYTISIFRPGPVEPKSWADLGPAFHALFGLILASAGALLALIGAIMAEFATRPRYLWITMIVVGSACILSFSGPYYKFFNSNQHIDWSELLF